MPEDMDKIEQKLTQLIQVIDYVKKKTLGNKSYLKNKTFLRALVEFLNDSRVQFDTFLKKLEFKVAVMGNRSKREDYRKLFLEIYNYKNYRPI